MMSLRLRAYKEGIIDKQFYSKHFNKYMRYYLNEIINWIDEMKSVAFFFCVKNTFRAGFSVKLIFVWKSNCRTKINS